MGTSVQSQLRTHRLIPAELDQNGNECYIYSIHVCSFFPYYCELVKTDLCNYGQLQLDVDVHPPISSYIQTGLQKHGPECKPIAFSLMSSAVCLIRSQTLTAETLM